MGISGIRASLLLLSRTQIPVITAQVRFWRSTRSKTALFHAQETRGARNSRSGMLPRPVNLQNAPLSLQNFPSRLQGVRRSRGTRSLVPLHDLRQDLNVRGSSGLEGLLEEAVLCDPALCITSLSSALLHACICTGSH